MSTEANNSNDDAAMARWRTQHYHATTNINDYDVNNNGGIDSSNSLTEEEKSKKNHFSLIQRRRFLLPCCDPSITLCPSMDLISYGIGQPDQQKQNQEASTQQEQHYDQEDKNSTRSATSSISETLTTSIIHIHRTVNWQKLATVTSGTATLSSVPLVAEENDNVIPSSSSFNSATTDSRKSYRYSHVAWRPDGRFIAIADTIGRVSLYSVEGMLNGNDSSNCPSNNEMSLADSKSLMFGGAGDDTDIPGKVYTIQPTCTSLSSSINTSITGLAWYHVGKSHPIWSTVTNDDMNEASVRGWFYDKVLDHVEPNDDNDKSQTNSEADLMWKYRTQFIDREQHLLPPSVYHSQCDLVPLSSSTGGGTNTVTTSLNSPFPTSQTPLSILFVVTRSADSSCSRDYLTTYLHGRYPIITQQQLGKMAVLDGGTVSIVTSADMSHTIIAPNTSSSQTVTICTTPKLAANRYTYQQIATLYSKIGTHIQTIQSNLAYILTSYKSSLKAIDLKLESLYKLLQNYGLVASDNDTMEESGSSADRNSVRLGKIRPLLVQHILSGHTRTSPNLSNAIDQFFTSVQMNDQLLVRMERSLSAAVSNVEKSLKQSILAPAIALHYSVDVLYGLGQYRSDIFPHVSDLQQLLGRTELLVLSIETTLTEIIKSRFRLRDFVAWLRSTGAQIKARGTAPKSVQRDNARKRRVPDSLIRRMLSYLRNDHERKEKLEKDDINKTILSSTKLSSSSSSLASYVSSGTEVLLDIKVSLLLSDSMDFVTFDDSVYDSEQSDPFNCHMNNHVPSVPDKSSSNIRNGLRTSARRTIPTAPFALSKIIQSVQTVFECPRSFVAKSTQLTRIHFEIGEVTSPGASKNLKTSNAPTNSSARRIAVTTRLGQGGTPKVSYYGEPNLGGYFAPSTVPQLDGFDDNCMPSGSSFRQWSLLANVTEADNQLLLHAIPLKWTSTTDNDEIDVDFNSDNDDDDKSVEERDIENNSINSKRCTVLAVQFQWLCHLSFPKDSTIEDVVFYSDDGKSSLLSSTVDGGGTGEEGRQGLGILLRRPNRIVEPETSASSKLELWFINYDMLPYSCVPIASSTWTGQDDEEEEKLNNVHLHVDTTKDLASQCLLEVQAIADDDDDDSLLWNDANGITFIKAKVRELSVSASEKGRYRLVLSGSRGIGAVYSTESNGTSVELLDLEEDEEVEMEQDDNGVSGDEDVDQPMNFDGEAEDDDVAMQTDFMGTGT